MKAVILAAGEGARLRPITRTRPKHLIKMGGKPLLEYCLRGIKTAGVEEVVMVVHYMADAIRNYIQDARDWGLNVEYVEQEEVLGTGDAVEAVESYVEDDFLVVYGDLLFDSHIVKKVIQMHEEHQSAATMAVVPVEHSEEYGIVEIEGGKVVKIVEKPRGEGVSNLANAGVYVFSREVFKKIRKTSVSVRGEREITDAISLMIQGEEQVAAAQISKEEWLDVGRPWNLLDANRWVLMREEHQIRGRVEDDAHLIGKVTVAKTARVRSGAYVEGPVFIGEGSDIGPNCYIRPYTSIGENVRIGNACEVKNCVVMDGTHIGHLSYVGDSVMGENCNLGAGTVTANLRLDNGNVMMTVKEESVNTGRRKLGMVLGDGVKTGVNALFMPGVKVGCNSWIGPNVIVYQDVEADKKVILKQDTEEKHLDS
ncbi:MAG: bifunctional sugar-1-phosphate nucleotidylyltransferase/acetyltransferase [Thermoproteota archaeon]